MLKHREESLRELHFARSAVDLTADLADAEERLDAFEEDALSKDEAIVELYEMLTGGGEDE